MDIRKYDEVQSNRIISVFSFILVLLTVWLSKTVYFGEIYYNLTRIITWIFIAVSLYIVPFTLQTGDKVAVRMLPVLLFFAGNLLTCLQSMTKTNINAVSGVILTMLCSAVTVVLVEKDKFAKYYIRIIFVYAVISLPCYFIQIFFRDIAYSLCQPGYNWKSGMGYSFFHTWGRNGTIYSRNAGPFWEPGAFQCFLNIAILFLLYNVDCNAIKHRKIVLCVLLLTVITTASTTGYIVFIIIIIIQRDRIADVLFQSEEAKENLPFILIVALVIISVTILPSIHAKISDEDNESTNLRTADVADGLDMVLKAGPFGLGETHQRNQLRSSMGLYKDDSAGLINLTYTYGWFMGIAYLILLWKMPQRIFGTSSQKENFLIFAIFVLFHMTEGLWSLSFFWCLLFFD